MIQNYFSFLLCLKVIYNWGQISKSPEAEHGFDQGVQPFSVQTILCRKVGAISVNWLPPKGTETPCSLPLLPPPPSSLWEHFYISAAVWLWQKLFSGIMLSLKLVHLYLYLITLILLRDSCMCFHLWPPLSNLLKYIYSTFFKILDKQNILILKKGSKIPLTI